MGCNDSYYYNPGLDKLLLTLEGQEDDFTRWFNGEISEGELPSSYNGYDRMVRADIRGILGPDAFWMAACDTQVPGEGEREGFFKITVLGAAPEKMEYLLGDGQRTEVIRGISYSKEQRDALNRGPFKQKTHRDYDPDQNCLTLAAGDRFPFGNGICLIVGVDSVRWTGSCQKQAETESLDCMADGLKSLIYFADQRGCAGSIPSACYPGMLRFLTGSGVDTSREFVLNETRCHIVDGRIREVGNVDGMPLTMYRRTRRENHIRLEEPLRSASCSGCRP